MSLTDETYIFKYTNCMMINSIKLGPNTNIVTNIFGNVPWYGLKTTNITTLLTKCPTYPSNYNIIIANHNSFLRSLMQLPDNTSYNGVSALLFIQADTDYRIGKFVAVLVRFNCNNTKNLHCEYLLTVQNTAEDMINKIKSFTSPSPYCNYIVHDFNKVLHYDKLLESLHSAY